MRAPLFYFEGVCEMCYVSAVGREERANAEGMHLDPYVHTWPGSLHAD